LRWYYWILRDAQNDGKGLWSEHWLCIFGLRFFMFVILSLAKYPVGLHLLLIIKLKINGFLNDSKEAFNPNMPACFTGFFAALRMTAKVYGLHTGSAYWVSGISCSLY
jgi:hypothetical protein